MSAPSDSDFDEYMNDVLARAKSDLDHQCKAHGQDDLATLVEDEKDVGFSLTDLKNWSDIAKALETVLSADELKEWLRGRLFKLFFMHFYQTALLPEQIQKKPTQGQGQYPNYAGWGLQEYTAQLIAQVIDTNTKDRDGLFHGRNWPDDWKEKITWWIFQLVKTDFALACVLKQGRALLALDQTEVEAIQSCITQDLEKASSEAPTSNTPVPNPGEVNPSASQAPSIGSQAKRKSKGPAPSPSKRTKPRDTEANLAPPNSTDSVAEVAATDGEEDSPYAAELSAGDWRAQAIIPTKRRVLNPSCTRMDMNNPWWQYQFIDNAIKNAPQSPNPAETTADNVASSQVKSRASPQWNQISVEPEEEQQVPGALSSLKHMIATVSEVNPYNAAMQWDTVWHEKLEVSNITLESPPKPELIEPDEAAIARAQEQQDWLDNPDAVLRFWQPVAINVIWEFAENLYLNGAILADSVGLGKTWTTAGYLLWKWNVAHTEKKNSKPTLLIVPPHLIYQWKSELTRITGEFDIRILYGDARSEIPGAKVVSRLSCRDTIFNGSWETQRIIIITAFQTLAKRHGPSAQAQWLANTKKVLIEEALLAPLDPKWEFRLKGCFGLLVIDEAHMLCNCESRQATTVEWCCGDFNLLLTATPIFNSYLDFQSLQTLVLSEEANKLRAKFDRNADFNPFLAKLDDPARIMCLSPEIVDRFVWNDKQLDPAICGIYIRQIWRYCMLRRSLSSKIGGRLVGSDIPTQHTHKLHPRFTLEEQLQYTQWVRQLRKALFIKQTTETGVEKIICNMATFRELLLITSWLWLRYSHDLLRAGNAKTILTKCANHSLVPELVKRAVELENRSLDGMVKWYRDAGKPIPAVEWRQEPPDYLPQTQINLLLQGSPKLRALLPILQQQIYEHGEKSII
ncbi:hypothetical protein BDW68DRAFT_179742 [Aspergillus falconensis]